MRTRHKVPSIFSLSMVDVLCCALGCVILLWLLNAKQTEDEADDQRRESVALLADAQAERTRRLEADASAKVERDKFAAQLRKLLADRDEAVLVSKKLADQLRLLQDSEAKLKVQLAGEQKLSKETEAKLKANGIRIVSLEGDVKKAASELDKAKKSAGGMTARLVDLETALKKLRGQLVVAVDARDKETKRAADLSKTITADKKELAVLAELLKQLRASKVKLEKTLTTKDDDLAGLLRDKKALEKLLAERAAALKTAQGTVTKLTGEALSLRAAADNRFAGIALTGKRVLFLVDTSGSMEMVDENTESKDKWKEVCSTIGRVLRSMPEIDKYQVIGFGPTLSWPLGGEGKWLDYDARTSPAQAEAAMRKVRPTGGTNMYIAMKAAFEFRKDGLDAIYLLSDGLPNQGEGVPPEKKAVKGMARGLLLGKYIRDQLRTTWNKPDAKKQRVKINTIGFFYDPDLGSFLWALARENDGSFVGMSRP